MLYVVCCTHFPRLLPYIYIHHFAGLHMNSRYFNYKPQPAANQARFITLNRKNGIKREYEHFGGCKWAIYYQIKPFTYRANRTRVLRTVFSFEKHELGQP